MSNNRLQGWLKEIWHWLGEAKLAFLGFLTVTNAMLYGFIVWHSEDSIRIAGYALQLIGMLFAIRGLLRIREYFKQPLLRRLIVNWIKQFPKWKKDIAMGWVKGQVSTTMMGTPRGEVWTPDDPGKPIEQRIEGIVKNLERMRDDLRKQAHSIDELERHHEEHKTHVAEENKKIKEDTQKELESLHTSDLLPSFVGLILLTTGITMSTLAHEFFEWLY